VLMGIRHVDCHDCCLVCPLPTEMSKNPPEGVSVGLGEDENIFCWDLFIVGPPDTLYEGGFFNAKLEFPQDFPNSPPVMTFKTPIWHPNGNFVIKTTIEPGYLTLCCLLIDDTIKSMMMGKFAFQFFILPVKIVSTNRFVWYSFRIVMVAFG
jgi:hypothetical protein